MTEKEQEATEQVENQITGAEENSETEKNPEEGKQYGEAENADPLEELQKQILDEKNKYLRLYAEFENFRKRSAKERIDLIGTASSDVLKEILPIIDDFERAIESNSNLNDIEAVKEGFKLLHNKLWRLMQSKGVEAINPKGEEFDGELHEAIAQMPAEREDEKGKIFDVVEKGYKLNEKIIRHPKVVVAS